MRIGFLALGSIHRDPEDCLWKATQGVLMVKERSPYTDKTLLRGADLHSNNAMYVITKRGVCD